MAAISRSNPKLTVRNRMSGSLTFKANELPDTIYEPLQTFSAISMDPDFHTRFQSALTRSYYYTCRTDDILALLEVIEHSGASYFAVSASCGNNELKWSSKDSTSYQLTLAERSISSNSYVQRYLPFTKAIPLKGSAQYATSYTATVKRSTEKYTPDVKAVVEAVFHNSSVTILADVSLDLKLITEEFQRRTGQSINTEISDFTDFSPLTLSNIGDDDQVEFSEYLGLLHLNSYPKLNDSHVSATTSYSHTIPVSDREVTCKLYLSFVSEVSPVVFSQFLSDQTCLSLQAKGKDTCNLTYFSGTGFYTWEMTKKEH